METRAYLKGTRLSPQKAALVADQTSASEKFVYSPSLPPASSPRAVNLQCCKGPLCAVDGLHVYELGLHFAAVSTGIFEFIAVFINTTSCTPGDDCAIRHQSCKGHVGGVDVLHACGQLLLDLAAKALLPQLGCHVSFADF